MAVVSAHWVYSAAGAQRISRAKSFVHGRGTHRRRKHFLSWMVENWGFGFCLKKHQCAAWVNEDVRDVDQRSCSSYLHPCCRKKYSKEERENVVGKMRGGGEIGLGSVWKRLIIHGIKCDRKGKWVNEFVLKLCRTRLPKALWILCAIQSWTAVLYSCSMLFVMYVIHVVCYLLYLYRCILHTVEVIVYTWSNCQP